VAPSVCEVSGRGNSTYFEDDLTLMTAKPDIILIITDQQRADTIAALGAPWTSRKFSQACAMPMPMASAGR